MYNEILDTILTTDFEIVFVYASECMWTKDKTLYKE